MAIGFIGNPNLATHSREARPTITMPDDANAVSLKLPTFWYNNHAFGSLKQKLNLRSKTSRLMLQNTTMLLHLSIKEQRNEFSTL